MLPLIASAGKGDLTRELVLHGFYYYLPPSSPPISSPLLPSSLPPPPSRSLADAISCLRTTGPRNEEVTVVTCVSFSPGLFTCVCVCVYVWACASVVHELAPLAGPFNAAAATAA